MIIEQVGREKIDKFMEFVKTYGMSKLEKDYCSINLSEIKSVAKLLSMKNTAGRKIKDPIMEKNLINWIKETSLSLGRPISRKEIKTSAR